MLSLCAAPRGSSPWQVPPASVLGCVRCGGLAFVYPVTHRTVRLSTGASGGAPELFRVDADTLHFRSE